MFVSTNPATEQTLAEYAEMSPEEVERALEYSWAAFERWRAQTPAERAAGLRRLALSLRSRAGTLAETITAEMGKPLEQSRLEIEKSWRALDTYAERGPGWLTPQNIRTEVAGHNVSFEPLGPVLAVLPWNYPVWQAVRAAAPVLMAGNSFVLKHAPNVLGCSESLNEVFAHAGLPAGLFTELRVAEPRVAGVIADDRIRGVTFTGSDRGGAAIAVAAGAAVKKCVLELGGSDPFVVLPDADVDRAASAAIYSRFQNSGQSCIAAKRIILTAEVADEFTECFLEKARRLVWGDPRARETQVGPLARADLRNDLLSMVQSAVSEGAEPRLVQEVSHSRGWFLPPTVLAGVRPEMAVASLETFGPVACLLRAETVDHAVQLANATRYGLAASVWGSRHRDAEAVASQIDAGAVFINTVPQSDARLPIGGVKASGYGRELGQWGLHEFVNVKTTSERAQDERRRGR